MRFFRRLLALAVVAATFSTTGCASSCATLMDPVPYAGLQVTGSVLAHDVTSDHLTSLALGTLLIADLPFSLALDTALLPVTVPCAVSSRDSEWRLRTAGF